MKYSFKTIAYWVCFAAYFFFLLPSAIAKVFQNTQMMDNMKNLGFNSTLTLLIGIIELLLLILVLIGIYKSQLRTLGFLLLFPIVISAFATHMAHQEYQYFYKALALCVLSFILLCLDRRVSVNLRMFKEPVGSLEPKS